MCHLQQDVSPRLENHRVCKTGRSSRRVLSSKSHYFPKFAVLSGPRNLPHKHYLWKVFSFRPLHIVETIKDCLRVCLYCSHFTLTPACRERLTSYASGTRIFCPATTLPSDKELAVTIASTTERTSRPSATDRAIDQMESPLPTVKTI